jgi:hypothetical protein
LGAGRQSGITGFSFARRDHLKTDHRSAQVYRPVIWAERKKK